MPEETRAEKIFKLIVAMREETNQRYTDLIGKWAAYYLNGNCCAGYGQIVGGGLLGLIEIDEHPGGRHKIGVARENIKVFDTPEKASKYYHKDDRKREALRFKELLKELRG